MAQTGIDDLTRLLAVAQAMTAEKDLDRLLALIVRETTELLNADRSTLFLLDEENDELYSRIAEGAGIREIRFPADRGIAGHVASTGNIINIPDAYQDDRFNQDIDRKTGYKTDTILCAPLISHDERTIGVIQVLNRRGGPFCDSDEQLLLAMGSYAAVTLDNARLVQHYVEKQKMEQSLAIAREVQEGLYPSEGMTKAGVQVNGWYRTCDETGGDYYDYFELLDGRIAIVVGDVSGHGIGPALLMAATRATLRGLAVSGIEPNIILTRLNELMCPDMGEGRFVTLFYGVIDPGSGEMQYASAGHDPPLLFAKDGSVTELDSTGLPLGILDDAVYEPGGLIVLEEGGILFLSTDGIWEAANPEGDAFGRERLMETARANLGRSSEILVREIVDAMEKHVGDGVVHDDLTLVTATRGETV
jgi:serine phosphatase RsbU (regulator of sigma subunit)